jgi:threonine dehydrogenase-like Zn-dependent dehydrogenase
MTKTIRAAVMVAPRKPIEVRELPWPVLEPGAAMLKTLYSEVCGTDVHLHHGKLAGVPYPIVPGHVSIGHLAEIRGTVTDIEGKPFREGDLVTFLDVHETCGRCYECLVTKQTTRCPSRKVYGISYGTADGPLGGWAEHIWMKPGVKLLRIPKGVDPISFIAGGCGLVTAVHAIERGDVRLGSSVAVLGAGPVGQAAIALARLAGADPVIAIGAPAARLEFAKKMGASHVIDLDVPAEERAARVREITGGHGVDVVIEAAGDPRAVPQALDLVRDGGRVVIAGQYTDGGDVAINPHRQINKKHAEIRGCWGCDYSHVHRALQVLARQGSALPWAESITAKFGIEQANEALAAVENRTVIKALIVPSAAHRCGLLASRAPRRFSLCVSAARDQRLHHTPGCSRAPCRQTGTPAAAIARAGRISMCRRTTTASSYSGRPRARTMRSRFSI